MSGATGRGLGSKLVAKMPGRCVAPSRGVRRSWGKRWDVGISRDGGTRRRARSSVLGTGCVLAERLQDCRRPWGRRQAAEAVGVNEDLGTPGTEDSIETARDPGAVWVNGAMGEPQLVGPAGSVWVTGIGEEVTACRSPQNCEKRGHESILELWLKVQAMRAASGWGEGSRVELHPVPAGEGPVERGVPGRASWVETSRAGVTGPWVRSHTVAVPQTTGLTTDMRLRAVCEKISALCGQGARVPPVGGSETTEISVGIAPHLLGTVQAARMPGTVEEIDRGVAPAPWGREPTLGVPGTVGWLEASEVPRAVEGSIDFMSAPGLRERGQSVQVPGTLAYEAVCSRDSPDLRQNGQAANLPDTAGVPRAIKEEATSVCVPGMWQRQAVEEISSGGIPDLWDSRQPVEVPCAIEESRYGGDPTFRERGQAVWVETGSGDESESWAEAAQTAGVSGLEQEAGPGGAPGLWGIEHSMGIPQALGKEADCGHVPGLWETEQPVGVSQPMVKLGSLGEQQKCGGIVGLCDGQQTPGMPLAEAVPGFVGDESCCGDILWKRRQALMEQTALIPPALGVPGCVDQETGCGDVLCLCRRKQAVGLSETVGRLQAAGVPKHRCASAVGVPRSARVPPRVPAAVWVSGPVDQENTFRDVISPMERADSARITPASEELWSLRENDGSAVFPESWGRRQAVGFPMTTRVSMASEVPERVWEDADLGGIPRSSGRRQSARSPVGAEMPEVPRVPGPQGIDNASGSFTGLPGRRQNVGVPVTTEVSTSGGVPVDLRPVQEETGSGNVSGLWGARAIVRGPADAIGPTRVGMPTTARMPGLLRENTGLGGISDLSGGRQTAGLSMTGGELCIVTGVPRPVGEEALSGGLLHFSGRRQTAEMSEATGVSMVVGIPVAAGPPGLMVNTSADDVSGVWRRRQATEVPVTARAPGPVEGETGSEDISDPWRRRPSGLIPEAARVPLSLGVCAAGGIPTDGHGSAPAEVWVTGSAGKDMNTAVRRQTTEGPGSSGEEMGGRSVLGLARRSQAPAVSYTCGQGTRLWNSLRSLGVEITCENVAGVTGIRTTVGVPEVVEVLPVPREEPGINRFRDHPQQSGRRQIAAVCGFRVGGDNLGEDGFRGTFQ